MTWQIVAHSYTAKLKAKLTDWLTEPYRSEHTISEIGKDSGEVERHSQIQIVMKLA